MKGKSLLLTCLPALLIISTIVVNVGSTPLPKLYVDPPSVVDPASCFFTINIKISNVVDMWSFQFRLTWNPSFLEIPDDPGTLNKVEGVAEGPFLKWGGPSPPEPTRITSQVNQATGTLDVAATILGVPLVDAYPASGNGTLVTITFHLVDAYGSSTLHLSNTFVYAIDPIDPYNPKPTDHTTGDGSFSDGGYEVKIHQTAPSKTVICQGHSGKFNGYDLNVTVHNVGTTTKTFNVATYYNSSSWTIIGTQPGTLGGKQTQTFKWNLTDVPKGKYVIKVTVGTNSYVSDYTIRITMEGDVVAEWGLVDIVDIVYVAIHFGARKGEPNYDAIADINGDGIIDIVDIVLIAIHFGERDP